MVLVDYLEAFDMIDHTLLLKKLEVYGLNRDSLQWFTSYLKEIKDAIWLSWETLSQVSLLFVMVFPRDPYLAPSYLSPLSMTYRFDLQYELELFQKVRGYPKLVNCRNRRLGSFEHDKLLRCYHVQ